MDWNTILFAARWVIIALFYFVLLVLLFGVYKETSFRLGQPPSKEAVTYGWLKVIQPGSDSNAPAGTTFSLKTITRLGADEDNDIILGDQFISGHHFQLRWDGAVWWLEDLYSKNGTLVNRQPVDPARPQALSEGALITAGDMVLELVE